jgi:hypothetical protein
MMSGSWSSLAKPDVSKKEPRFLLELMNHLLFKNKTPLCSLQRFARTSSRFWVNALAIMSIRRTE